MPWLIATLAVLWPAAALAAAPSPTPGPLPTPGPGEVRLNEFLPNPVGTDSGHEWLELANVGERTVDIGGLVTKRASGSTVATIPAGTQLAPGAIHLVDPISGSLLNAGDTLTLLAGSAELDRVVYDGDGQEGWSWARLSAADGAWTTEPSPGEANPAPVTAPEEGEAEARSATAKAASAATKPKKAAAGKLPAGGPHPAAMLLPFTLGMLYWYLRRRS